MIWSRLLMPVALVCSGLGSPCSQAAPVLDLNAGGLSTPCSNCGFTGTTFGWSFTAHASFTVNALGAWDDDGDGLGRPVDLGLYTATGVLLRSVTVDDLSPHVQSASGLGDWVVGSVADLALDAGDYVIGEVFTDLGPNAQVGASYTASPWISVTGGVMSSQGDAGLTAPLDGAPEPVFGPTFFVVPEPGSLPIAVVALGGLGLAGRRRQRS